jgi:hypothetical protein
VCTIFIELALHQLFKAALNANGRFVERANVTFFAI